MQYNLFLDDDSTRLPHMLTWIELLLVEWTRVWNYKQFVETILQKGVPERVSFDHDLADEHYPDGVGIYLNDPRCKTFKIPYDTYREKTGYHCCKWLIEYCIKKNVPFPEYYIHTLNPIGKLNIQSLIDSYKKVYGSNQ